MQHIRHLPDTIVTATSDFFETDPVDAPPGSGRFINAAAVVETDLAPAALMQSLLEIERSLGRHRSDAQLKNSPRPVDLDLLLYGDLVVSTPQLTIPHPRMHQRRFVLEPLAQIVPNFWHPTSGKTIRQLLATLNPPASTPSTGTSMKVLHTIAEFRQWRLSQPNPPTPLPFVPTMGALHDGHASLVRQAKAMTGTGSGKVIASIFVNPTQFGPSEDFTKYPRTLEADVNLLARAGCDAVFVPSAQEMYGDAILNAQTQDAATTLDPGPLANLLEGAIRPGHFRGVCTVVLKLLNITQPTHMLMGQKDFQQQAVLRQMCHDLNVPVEVVTLPTIREPDGLAMSSRNRYLNPDERSRAVALHEALTAAKQSYDHGERSPATLERTMHEKIKARGLTVQYAVVRHADTLHEFPGPIMLPVVFLVAAKLGSTRLIDNLLIPSPTPA